MSWWAWVLIGFGVLYASWMLFVLLAARLPEGSLKELAGFLPDCVTTARRLRGDPRVPARAKFAIGFALVWVLSPIDLIPEFLPIIGPLDDVVVVALAFRYAARQVPRSLLLEAWPGNASTIERVLGPASAGKDEPPHDSADADPTAPSCRSGASVPLPLLAPGPRPIDESGAGLDSPTDVEAADRTLPGGCPTQGPAHRMRTPGRIR